MLVNRLNVKWVISDDQAEETKDTSLFSKYYNTVKETTTHLFSRVKPQKKEHPSSELFYARFSNLGSSNLHDIRVYQFSFDGVVEPPKEGFIWLVVTSEEIRSQGKILVNKAEIVDKIFGGHDPGDADWMTEIHNRLDFLTPLDLQNSTKDDLIAWDKMHSGALAQEMCRMIEKGDESDTQICEYLDKCNFLIQGKAQEQFLQSTIRSGSFLLVKKLLELGVPPGMTYTRPAGEWHNPLPTPLVQAIDTGCLDVIALLLSKGASLDPQDNENVDVIDHIQKKKVLSQDMELWHLLETYSKNKEEIAQKRFQSALQSQNWVEIKRMVKEGYEPEQPVYKWVEKALSEGQTYLVKIMLEKGHLREVTPQLLTLSLGQEQQSWSRWFFSVIASRNIPVLDNADATPVMQIFSRALQLSNPSYLHDQKYLLKMAISSKNYPLAAYLMKLGIGLESTNDTYKELTDYAEKLKIGSKNVQDFKAAITTKNVALLTGDSIIRGMVDDTNNKLEGDISSESFEFMIVCLRMLAESHPEVRTKELEQVLLNMENMKELAGEVDSIRVLREPYQIDYAIKLFEKDFFKAIDRLAVGDSMLIPGGWNTYELGHAILIDCIKISENELEFQVINTGEGVDIHGGAYDKARLHVNTLRRYRITREVLNNEHPIRNILEMLTSVKKRKIDESDSEYSPDDFYAFFEPYLIKENLIEEKQIRKAQQAGTCPLRCWLAYWKLKLESKQYKYLKPILSEQVVKTASDLNKEILYQQPVLAKLLSLAATHLFDNLVKRVSRSEVNVQNEEEALLRLDEISKNIKSAIPLPSSEHSTLPLELSLPTATYTLVTCIYKALLSQDWIGGITQIAWNGYLYIKSFDTKPQSVLPFVDFYRIQIPQELEKHLLDAITYAKNSENTIFVSQYVSSLLISLGRVFITINTALFLRELENDPNSCNKIIRYMDELTTFLEFDVSKTKIEMNNPAVSMAIQFAFSSVLELSKLIEQALQYPVGGRIEDYGIHDKDWLENETSLKTHALLDPDLEEDVRLLRDYKRQHASHEENSLFNYKRQHQFFKYDYGLLIRKSSSEFYYAEHIAKKNNDWSTCDAAYNLEMKMNLNSFEVPSISLEDWRVFWAYHYLVPEHFTHLKRLNYLCHTYVLGHGLFTPLHKNFLTPLALTNMERKDAEHKKIFFAHYGFVCTKERAPLPGIATSSIQQIYPVCHAEVEMFDGSGDSVALHLNLDSTHNQITAIKENIYARQLMGIRTLISDNLNPFAQPHPLAIPFILDWFGDEHIQELDGSKYQIFMENTIFASLRMYVGLKEIPKLPEQLIDFFKSAIGFYQEKVETSTSLQSSMPTLTFLYIQFQRALSYMHKAEVSSVDINREMVNLRNEIKNALQHPAFRLSDDLLNQLHVALIDSYHVPGDPHEEIYDMLTSITANYIRVQNSGVDDTMTPAFYHSALTLPIKKAKEIQHNLKEDPSFTTRVLNSMMKHYSIVLPGDVLWKESMFPIFQCKYRSNIYDLNVLTGDLKINKKKAITLSEEVCFSSSIYKNAIGQKRIHATDCGDHYESSDEYGDIIITINSLTNKINGIKRRIQGHWFSMGRFS